MEAVSSSLDTSPAGRGVRNDFTALLFADMTLLETTAGHELTSAEGTGREGVLKEEKALAVTGVQLSLDP